MSAGDWPAIAAARRAAVARLPLVVDGRVVGSVAREHLPELRRIAGDAVSIGDAVTWPTADGHRDEALATWHEALHAAGHVIGWRDEPYAVLEHAGAPVLATIERAASRYWGTLTFGAHCNGYVADGDGRPAHLWIARRSLSKSTDPGLLDNLVGGGVPAGQSPRETLLREGWEEAGLTRERMGLAHPGRVIRLARDIPEGFQHEWLYAFDLALPPGLVPRNQDGEVMEFRMLPVAEALRLAATDEMTVDAALVTLDFALRHHLLGDRHDELQSRFEPLLARPPFTA